MGFVGKISQPVFDAAENQWGAALVGLTFPDLLDWEPTTIPIRE